MKRWRIAVAGALLAAVAAGAGAQTPGAGGKDVHLGVASCAGNNCHGAVEPFPNSRVAQDEYLIWAHKDKHAKAFAALQGERGRRIAKNLGLPDAEHAAICLDCHADNVPPERRGPQFRLADGVGCESCHGGASSWLGIHVSGADHAANLAAGLYPLEQPQARGERCLSCHLGDDKRFATHRIMGAGHPPLGFELDTYSAIQPAHYRVDQDYVERKGRPDDLRTWAVGQAVDVKKRMELLLDERNRPKGVQPELALFDCQACHHPMTSLQWRPRTSAGLPPGALRLYDATAVMLHVAAERVAPQIAAELHDHLLALHRATTEDWAAVRREAEAVRGAADRLIPLLTAHSFGRDDAVALAKAVIASGLAGNDLDYSAAQQQTMALASIVAAMTQAGDADAGQIASLNEALRGLYDAVADGNTYEPEAFAQALRQFSAKLPA